MEHVTVTLRSSFTSCGEAPCFSKVKTKFRGRFNSYQFVHLSYRKNVLQQRFHEHYGKNSHNGIDDWQFTLIEQCETQEQLRNFNFLLFWYFSFVFCVNQVADLALDTLLSLIFPLLYFLMVWSILQYYILLLPVICFFPSFFSLFIFIIYLFIIVTY